MIRLFDSVTEEEIKLLETFAAQTGQ
jgi:hypothetical protein